MKRYLHKIRSTIIRPWLLRQSGYFNYSSAYYQARILHKYDSPGAYLALYEKCLNAESLKTDVDIHFLDGVDFGANLKQVISCLPEKTPYDILNHEALNIKIIFYKVVIAEYRVKCQIHFFGDRMFLCNYLFSYLREDEIQHVIKILRKKYLPDTEHYSQELISDHKGNYISLETSMGLSFNYLSAGHGLYESIREFSEKLDLQKKARLSAGDMEIYNSL